MLNLRLEFQYTFEDFEQGQREIVKAIFKSTNRSSAKIGWLLFIVIAAVCFVYLHYRGSTSTPPVASTQPTEQNLATDILLPLLPYLAWVVGVGLVIAIAVRGKWGLRRIWARETRMHDPRIVEINDESIRIRTATSDSTVQWIAFVRSAETPKLFVLFLSDSKVELIPKRAFGSVEEAATFREFLARAVNAA